MAEVRLTDIIAPPFYEVHRALRAGEIDELWAKGGRGSTKSSFASVEIMLGLTSDPQAHAFVTRRFDNELRDSVLGQMEWAARKLGIDHLWHFGTSPMQATHKKTGQKVFFRGADSPEKGKSINPGFGYVKYFWAEEVDQFGGMDELRVILQSIFRGEGSSGQVAFSTFNPPKSARSWVNAEVKVPKHRRTVHHSDYTDVPPEWLGQRFLADAEHLKLVNAEAYRHEYLGEEIGTGLEVFNNVRIEALDDEEVAALGEIRQGLDWGYAADPVCLVRMSYDRKRRKLTIFGEISGVGIGNRALNERTPEEWKRTLTKCDSSEPKSRDEMRDDYGWKIIDAAKGPGSVEFGVKWLTELEQIVIDPVRCPLAAKEFVNYALEISRNGEVVSKYPDKGNHSLDAVRYGLEDVMKPEARPVPKVVPIPTANRW